MPRRSKGPRLYLRAARADHKADAVWVIRDGTREISTGCGPERLRGSDGAEAHLARYIASKYEPPVKRDGPGDPAEILIADVVTYYARERAPHVADPVSTGIRLRKITEWWAGKTLADIKRSECQAYIAARTSEPLAQAKYGKALERRVSVSGARRELDDLSAAIGYWHAEYPLSRKPIVWKPPKGESPRDALTRNEAARLLKAARGYRLVQDEGAEGAAKWEKIPGRARESRAHLRRFLLIGLYTGTRPGVIPKLLWHESPTQAWVDLEAETIFRRGKHEKEHRNKRRPLVRMPRRLAAHMRRWKAADARRQADRARAAKKAKETPRDAPLTVLHHGGKPIGGRIRKGFHSLVIDAGLNPEITPHWMRHTCATWLMEGNVQVWEAAAYTGMSAQTLETVYAHARADHQSKARKALQTPALKAKPAT